MRLVGIMRAYRCFLKAGFPDAISHKHTWYQFQPLIDDYDTYLNEFLFSSNFMGAFTPPGLCAFLWVFPLAASKKARAIDENTRLYQYRMRIAL